jgi:acetyl-CoA C-acetyltransferase
VCRRGGPRIKASSRGGRWRAVLTTLVHALHRHGKRYGLASLCLGGGNAVAMIVERV